MRTVSLAPRRLRHLESDLVIGKLLSYADNCDIYPSSRAQLLPAATCVDESHLIESYTKFFDRPVLVEMCWSKGRAKNH